MTDEDDDLSTSDALARHLADLVEDCEEYIKGQQDGWDKAQAYFKGEIPDLQHDADRSGMVSKDVRSIIKKLMPSIKRTLMGNANLVEYHPTKQGDDEIAEQATEYVNRVVIPECGAVDALHDAIFDALLLKTGILKWAAYRTQKAEIHEFTDLSDDEALGLFDDPANEIYEHEKTEETDPAVLELDPNARRHSFKIRRTADKVDIRLEAVRRQAFLMHPRATKIEDSPVVGERLELTRSDLVEMGFDRETVWQIAEQDWRDDERYARRDDDWRESDTVKAMDNVVVYELYVRLDMDEDGIAEMYRIMFAELDERQPGDAENGTNSHIVLDMEPVSEAPYSAVVSERDAHEWEGCGVFDDLNDIQRAKTFFLRNAIDNLNWQNNLQPAVDFSALHDADAVFTPEFGKPILLKQGRNAQEALQFMQVPFVAEKSFGMMGYMDEAAKDRTGITDASGGVDPEAFQQMTATSAQLMSEAGIAQAWTIVNELAKGIRTAFTGVLKLVVSHHDQPRTVRVSGEWKAYDPRAWNADLDCTVNVGLGAGSRERDLGMLQVVLGLQKELLATIGPNNPYVKPDQLYNTLARITEAAGFKDVAPYFTKPDEQEIAALLNKPQQPDPAMVKVQAQMQLEQVKAEASQRIEEAQMQADLRVKEAEAQAKLHVETLKADQQKEIALLKAEIDITKHREEMKFKREQAAMDAVNNAPIVPGGLVHAG